MAKSKVAGPMKDFTNVAEVFDRMEELGFFMTRSHRDEEFAKITDQTFAPLRSNEFWFSNGAIEVKIFKEMFGSYTLCNYRQAIHKDLDSLFELAEIPRIKG